MLEFTETSKRPVNVAIYMYSYFKKDKIFACELYGIYYGSPFKSETVPSLILYLLHDKCESLPERMLGAQHKSKLFFEQKFRSLDHWLLGKSTSSS